MSLLRALSISFTFIGALFGAGLASGKEIAVFLGSSSVWGILICTITIGASSSLFMIANQYANGDIEYFIFGKYHRFGNIIIRIINLIFLSAMLSGAENLLLDTLNFKGGGVLVGMLVISIFYLGENSIKHISNIVIPLMILLIVFVFVKYSNSIVGSSQPLRPILYATMNSSCAGLYLANSYKNISKKEVFLSALLMILILSILFLFIRSIIVGYEQTSFPIISVSRDTYLRYICITFIFCAILTSAVSNLKLCINSSNTLSPYIMLAYALALSSLGFNHLVAYVYPFIGAIGCVILLLVFAKVISLKLKLKKRGVYL